MPPEPWDQQEGEDNKDFARFSIYCGLGPTRSINLTESLSLGKPRKATPSGSWSDLASRRRWVERSQAWDKAQAIKMKEAATSDREQAATLNEKGIALASQLFVKFLTEAAGMSSKDAIKRMNEMLGRGRHGDFILNGHKTLFGEKHEVKISDTYKTVDFSAPE